jgi:hypothetical protein
MQRPCVAVIPELNDGEVLMHDHRFVLATSVNVAPVEFGGVVTCLHFCCPLLERLEGEALRRCLVSFCRRWIAEGAKLWARTMRP